MGNKAENDAFNHGYVIACCNLQNLHDLASIASDTLCQAGITQAQINAMNLIEYDASALAKIREARSLDPITT